MCFKLFTCDFILSVAQFLISLLWVLIIVRQKPFSYATVWQHYVCVSSPKVEELQDTFIPNPNMVSHGIPVLQLGVQSVLVFLPGEVLKCIDAKARCQMQKIAPKNTHVVVAQLKGISSTMPVLFSGAFEELNSLLFVLVVLAFCKPLT